MNFDFPTDGGAGPQGAAGPQGSAGGSGPQGAAGSTGPAGPQGAAGAAGVQGVQGAGGAAGAQGVQGSTGSPGSTGPQGAAGAAGGQGVQGVQGVQGSTGPAPSGAANLVQATPNGSSGTATLRALVAADLPTIPVTAGGTGQTTLVSHGVLVGEGSSSVSGAAPGTAGQVLTSLGASSDPAMLDPITAAVGSTTLAATYTISADNGSYEDTGLFVALPSAGTYLVWYQARSNIVAVTTAGAYILTEMYNSTDAAVVASSEQIGAYGTTTSASYYRVATVPMLITVAAAKTIKLYAKVIAPGTTSTRTINSDANGRSRMGYVKLHYA